MAEENPTGEILVYQNDDGSLKLDVKLQDETVWLSQSQLVQLYASSKANVSEHIKNIFEEGELFQEATVRNFRTVQTEGSRTYCCGSHLRPGRFFKAVHGAYLVQRGFSAEERCRHCQELS